MNILKKISSWYFSKSALPYWGILALDSAIVLFSGYLTRYLEVGGAEFTSGFWQYTRGLLVTLACFLVSFYVHHTYRGIVRYSSFVDLHRCVYATFWGSLSTFCLWALFNVYLHLDASILMPDKYGVLIIFLLTTLLMWGERVLVKSMYDGFHDTDNAQKAVIYGIREGGVAIAKDIQNQNPRKYELAGFISPEGDDNPGYLMGVRTFAEDDDIVTRLQDKNIKVVIVSPLQSDHFREREALINDLIAAGIHIMMVPSAEEWDGKSPIQQSRLRDVEIEDLLPREKIEVDMEDIGRQLYGKKILITGAAGSIGSEMVRQVAVYHPAEMILIDQAETPMHDMRLLMRSKFPDVPCLTVVATITDREYMEQLFAAHRPDYVFHAAAYKHVPMMEDNPVEAVRNNISGTRIIADLAVKYGTKKFVMISTDKAVNPTNVMGCSKRICEIYCQSLNKAIAEGKVQGGTQFVTTRFGNVLGSNGSVIPLFKQQIRDGGPITVTHPDIIRFFMLIPEACKLVLEAGTMGRGGEIFVFDMGKPVRIVDLAKRMIALSGARDVQIKFTGLRDGEKLYEEVLSDKENTIPTSHPKIMTAKVREYDYDTACANEERLLAATSSFDNMAIVRIMKEIVPEYKSQESIYKVLDK